MAARAIWKGKICLGEDRLPVKLYSAVEDRSIHFHLLHDQDLARLRQRMAHPDTNETVPRERIHKGYEVRRDAFVTLDEEDFNQLEPPASRDVEVLQFVDPAAINHQWYDRPYWLGPDGDGDAYFAFATALGDAQLEAVVRWVMRKKRYVGAMRVEQGYLALMTMRHTEEIVPASRLEAPQGRALDKRERDMAGKLLEALEADFDPAEFHDEYRGRVWEMIQTKREGGTVEIKEVKEKPQTGSLADALGASLDAVAK